MNDSNAECKTTSYGGRGVYQGDTMPRADNEINRELDRLEAAACDLSEIAAQVSDCFSPVLRQGTPTPGGIAPGNPDSATNTLVGAGISKLRRKIEGSLEILIDVLSRREI